MPSSRHARIEVDRTIDAVAIVLADYGGVGIQPDHAHDYATISFVVSGEVLERVLGRRRRVGPGAVLVKPAGVVHADEFTGDRTHLLSLRERRSRRGDAAIAVHQDDYAIRRDAPLTTAFFALERALGAGAPSRGIQRALAAVEVALAGGSPRIRGPRWCDAIAAALEADPFLDTATLAAERGMHPVSLARAFRVRFGLSPSAFARRVRIERAAADLGEGRPISTAALDAGFADQAHLTRCFGAEFGVTPGEYRRSRGI